MSEAKFTKGEWVADLSSDGQISILAGGEHLPVADVEVSYYPRTGELGEFSCSDEQKANAHLIATAPEMYKMLDAIASLMILPPEHVLEQLLAKARGEHD